MLRLTRSDLVDRLERECFVAKQYTSGLCCQPGVFILTTLTANLPARHSQYDSGSYCHIGTAKSCMSKRHLPAWQCQNGRVGGFSAILAVPAILAAAPPLPDRDSSPLAVSTPQRIR